MRLFDTHCHLNHDFPERLGPLMRRAQHVGLAAMVVPAVAPSDWEACAALTEAYPGFVHVALGVHPQEVAGLSDEALSEAIGRLPEALQRAGAVAVGEIGLDSRMTDSEEGEARQLRVFRRQLAICRDLDLAPIIHCVHAHDTMLATLRGDGLPPRGGVLHAFTGSVELVEVYQEVGAYFSFCGPVTWPNARKPPQACAAVPDDRLLIESDAPYQAPHPHQGEDNLPEYIAHVARKVAELRGLDLEAVAELTWRNAEAVFGLEG